MDQVLIGVVLALLGLALCFLGLRLWYLVLPLLGAVVGFYVGARVVQELMGTGYLSTALSWLGGLLLGIVFAIFSWVFWYIGVILLAACLGGLLASGILHALFENPWGWTLVLVTALGAVLFALLAIALQAPSYLIVAASAVVGGALTVTGVMMMFGIITISELSNGFAIAAVDEIKNQEASWLWGAAWLVLAIAGYMFQNQRISAVVLPEQRWVQARAVA